MKSLEDGIKDLRGRIARWDQERTSRASAVSSALLNASSNPVQLQSELAVSEEVLRNIKQPAIRQNIDLLNQQLQTISQTTGLPLSSLYLSSINELNTRFA